MWPELKQPEHRKLGQADKQAVKLPPSHQAHLGHTGFNTQSMASRHTASIASLLLAVQEALAEEISLARAALRPWARRADKQAARATQEPQPQLGPARTSSGRQPLGRQLSKAGSSLGSPLSSTGSGRGIDAYLARSTRDGDNPEAISQVNPLMFPPATDNTFSRL